MGTLLTVENLLALLSLTALEIVLGIDNIVFIAILVGKVEPTSRTIVRRVGLILAMGMRILLLLTISAVMLLTKPLFTVFGQGIAGRDLILLIGGLFLIGKATYEIHDRLEGSGHDGEMRIKKLAPTSALVQIMLLDIVFSLDSVITAVGMVDHVTIMIVAIVIAVGVMLAFSGKISSFIDKHPTFKMLALSFLLMIGVLLVAEGLGKHIDRAYIYFAMGFSLLVELLNMRSGERRSSAQEKAH